MREDEIKSIQRADASENFQIRIEKLDAVKVSEPKDKRCVGTAPQIVVEAFLKLPEGHRKSLIERGIVTRGAAMEERAYYGGVTIELFYRSFMLSLSCDQSPRLVARSNLAPAGIVLAASGSFPSESKR
jgi:hypothetical protein